MRHALFIAFHFPPEASSSGVLRTLKYAKYLPEHGWRVSVVTVDRSAYAVRDERLEQQVPVGTQVVRTGFRNTKRHFACRGIYPALLALPDVWIGWYPFAVGEASRLLLRDPADIVYSTSPHATAHLIAMRVAQRHRLPWIADLRDPWVEDPPEPGTPNGPLYRRLNRWLEQRTVRRASCVVTSTMHLRDELCRRYPDLPSNRFRAILNGYDEDDFQGIDVAPTSARGDRLVMLHAGSINAAFRDPRPLIASLGALVREGVLSREEIVLRFIGAGPYGDSQDVRDTVVRAGLSNAVAFVPRVPYDEALRELATADVLLLLQASDDTVGLVPAKLYEYLRSNRPTLALARVGAVTEVLAMTGGGFAVDPADPTALSLALRTIVASWRNGTLGTHAANRDVLRRFDRRMLTAELAGVMDAAHAAFVRNG